MTKLAAKHSTLEEAYPVIDPGVRPFGKRVLVQLPNVKRYSAAGIELIEETRTTEKFNAATGKVIALGPLAFKHPETMEPWPEGAWANVGDYVRLPRYGGDRIERKYDDGKGLVDTIIFVTVNAHELISMVTGDPLDTNAYL